MAATHTVEVRCSRCSTTAAFDPVAKIQEYEFNRYRSPGENLAEPLNASLAQVAMLRPAGWGAARMLLTEPGQVESKVFAHRDLCPECMTLVMSFLNGDETHAKKGGQDGNG